MTVSSIGIAPKPPQEALGCSSMPTDLDRGFHHTPWSGRANNLLLPAPQDILLGKKKKIVLALDSADRTPMVFCGGSLWGRLRQGLDLMTEVTAFWPLCLICHNPGV